MSKPEGPVDPAEPLPYAAPVPDEDEGETGQASRRPPKSVRIAVRLMFANAVFALLALVSALATPAADYRETVRAYDASLTAEQIDQYAGDLLRYHATVSALILLANLAQTNPVGRGRGWARVAAWHLTGMGLVLLLAGGAPGDALSVLLTVVGIAVDIAIIVLLASKRSRAFFPRRSPRVR
ncbi:MAG: hypothetical protein JWM93_1964 [Frankiales bacterium]|nr:hypothetical protein [Frankiales bacterium]